MRSHETDIDDPIMVSLRKGGVAEAEVVQAALKCWGREMANAIDQQQVICGGEPIVILEGDTEINGKPRKVKPTFAMANSI